MVRRSSSDGIVMLIVYTIGLAFVIIGYSIKFLETVHKYHQWSKFLLTFPFLVIGNYIAYLTLNTNINEAVMIFTISWLSFSIFWFLVLDKEISIEKEKIQAQKDELVSNIAIETPNCPYCGERLKKFPMRKTRCPYCDNFIFVRTRPKDNKSFLVKQENIEKLESQWSKKKNNKQITVIDVSDEMDRVFNYLTTNFEKWCNYPQILQIDAEDRLHVMQYMWNHWDIRINEKKMCQEFNQYDKELLNEIRDVEENRRYTFFKMQEFKERGWEREPLVKTGWMPYEYGTALGICTIESMPYVFEWYLSKYNTEEQFPNYLEMPSDCFAAEIPNYDIYLFKNNDFHKVTSQELKIFCKENRYSYPYNI